MIRIGMKELERARRLQEEAAKLHLPSPPVTSFKISRTENGKIKDILHAKSNSYVRNAYNALAHIFTFAWGGLADGARFGDGILSYMSSTGFRTTTPPIRYLNNQVDMVLGIGTNGTADTLDDTSLDEITGVQASPTNRTSAFDSSSRRFITVVSRNFSNTSTTTYEIRESGIYVTDSSLRTFLMLRDTFPAVTFAPGDSISFSYQLEVYYPPVN